EIPSALGTVRSYARYTNASLQERPNGDLRFGLKLFPTLRNAPTSTAIDRDRSLADSLDVNAISVIVAPEGARGRALDSLTRTLEALRGDSTTLIVTLGYPQDAKRAFTESHQDY